MGNGVVGQHLTIEDFRMYSAEYDKFRSVGLSVDETYLIMRRRVDLARKDSLCAISSFSSNIGANQSISSCVLPAKTHQWAPPESKVSLQSSTGKDSSLRQVQFVSQETLGDPDKFRTSFLSPAQSEAVAASSAALSKGVPTPVDPPAPAHFSKKKPLALLIDDSAVAARVAAKTLQNKNFEVISATSARLGYNLLLTRATEIDIVFLDVVMPEVDGVECLGWIKENKTVSHIPVHMLSGLEDNMLAEVCVERGAESMLLKPLNASIIDKIARNRGYNVLT